MEESGLKKKEKNKISFYLWFIILGLNLVFIFLALSAPCLQNRWPKIGSAIYLIFSPFCHQRPDRTFAVSDQPMALCARCLGLLSGFCLGTIIYLFFPKSKLNKEPKFAWLIGLSIPMAIDLIGNISHFWSTSNGLRFLIGLSFGTGLPFYFLPVMFSFLDERFSQGNFLKNFIKKQAKAKD